MSDLKKLRSEIDRLDGNIVELLNRRASVAKEIARIKASGSADSYYAPVREKQVYERVCAMNDGPLPAEALRSIYREIMSATLALERPIRVAYLGPQTTFTHMATLERFGSSAQLLACNSIDSVFGSVAKREADYGVVPVENSTEGAVNHTLDMFIESDLKIYGEVYIEISHQLLSTVPLGSIKHLYTHPQPYAQSKSWLRANLPGVEVREVYSTARAAEMALEDSEGAAIASRLAASFYGLEIVAERIEDDPSNRTRFLIISRTALDEASGCDKTSVMFSVPHCAGALYRALRPFDEQKVSLTMIESRPARRPWEYVFFIDALGHYASPEIVSCLTDLESQALFVKVLGSYPTAD